MNLPKVQSKKLGSGKRGNLDTVKYMKQVAHQRKGHPKVRRLALAILESRFRPNDSHNYADEALAIGEYVQKNVRYVKDPMGIEYLQDPLMMIENLERGIAVGDCDDMSLFIATLLLSIGHQPYFRTVRYRGKAGPYNHIYVVVYEGNLINRGKKLRIPLDGIVKEKPIGFEVPHVSGDEYRV